MTLSIMELTKMTLTIMTLSIMIPSLLTLSIKVLFVTLRINDRSIRTLSTEYRVPLCSKPLY